MIVDEARAFAVHAHGEQRYGEQAYSVHLDAVAELAAPYGDEARAIAYLHDTVEDTDATLEQVREQFGARVADCVALLTDASGDSRKERKAKTYARLAEVNTKGELALALVVKAADRLANVRASSRDANQRLLDMYRGEQNAFRSAAYRPGLCDPLWAELERLLS